MSPWVLYLCSTSHHVRGGGSPSGSRLPGFPGGSRSILQSQETGPAVGESTGVKGQTAGLGPRALSPGPHCPPGQQHPVLPNGTEKQLLTLICPVSLQPLQTCSRISTFKVTGTNLTSSFACEESVSAQGTCREESPCLHCLGSCAGLPSSRGNSRPPPAKRPARSQLLCGPPPAFCLDGKRPLPRGQLFPGSSPSLLNPPTARAPLGLRKGDPGGRCGRPAAPARCCHSTQEASVLTQPGRTFTDKVEYISS